jgi:SAM-dependent methyltransferase
VVEGTRGLEATNARYRILPPEQLRSFRPTVHLADVQDLSRFPLRGLDLVVSQVVLAHVARKDRALEESARLLAPGGTFLHEIDHLDAERPDSVDADLPRFAIYEDGARISTRAYLQRHGIEIRIGKAAGPEVVLAIFRKGDGELDLGLQLDAKSTIVLRSLVTSDPEARLWGVRSVYRTPPERLTRG